MRLPLELVDDIIDEVFDALSTWAGIQKACSSRTLSSLALVSYPFRQRVNMHRFSDISLYEETTSRLSHVHAFLALLKSDASLSNGVDVARCVRKLHISLGDRTKSAASRRRERVERHPALEDGSYADILNRIFRGSVIHSPTTGRSYTLFISTPYVYNPQMVGISWESLSAIFILALKSLLNESNITTLGLTRIFNVPYSFLSEGRITRLILHSVAFHSSSTRVLQNLAPLHLLETLELHRSSFFTRAGTVILPALPALKHLSFTSKFVEMLSTVPDQLIWKYLVGLETISIYVENHFWPEKIPEFAIGYENLQHLKKLVVYVDLDPDKGSGDSLGNVVNNICLGAPPCDLEICFRAECLQPLDQARNGPAKLLGRRFDYITVDMSLHDYVKKSTTKVTIRFDIIVIHNVNVSFDYFDEQEFGEDLQIFARRSFSLMYKTRSGRKVLETLESERRVKPSGGDICNISLAILYSIS